MAIGERSLLYLMVRFERRPGDKSIVFSQISCKVTLHVAIGLNLGYYKPQNKTLTYCTQKTAPMSEYWASTSMPEALSSKVSIT